MPLGDNSGNIYSAPTYNARMGFDLSGFPGMGGAAGPIVGMLLQQLLPGILGSGSIPGPFMPSGQNIFSHAQGVEAYRQRMDAANLAGKQDQEFYQRVIRNLSEASGVTWGSSQAAAAQRMAGDFGTYVAPVMEAMMPEMWDRMHGFRGSARVLGRNIADAAQMAYDPKTGMIGVRGGLPGQVAQDVSSEMYGTSKRFLTEFSGLTQGAAGLAYKEMTQRGLTGGGFNKDSVINSLKEMSGAVVAMKEIFGDMGISDAPMPKIFNAIQELTQNSLGRFSPEKIAQSIRTINLTAKMTGMGVEAFGAIAAGLGGLADKLGVDRSLLAGATGDAALMAHAYGADGGVGFRRLSKEEFQGTASRLNVQAAGSLTANMLGTVMALRDRNLINGNSEGARLAEAIATHQTTYDGGKSIFMSPQQMRGILINSGANAAVISSYMDMPGMTQEQVVKYNLGRLARTGQLITDVSPMGQMSFNSAAMALGYRGNIDVGAVADTAIRGAKNRGDTDAMAAIITDALVKAGVPLNQAREIATLGGNNFSMSSQNLTGLAGYQLYDVNDTRLGGIAGRTQNQIDAMQRVQSRMAGFGTQGPLMRIFEALGSNNGWLGTNKLLGAALGGLDQETIGKMLAEGGNIVGLQQVFDSKNLTPLMRGGFESLLEQHLKQLQDITPSSFLEALPGTKQGAPGAKEPTKITGWLRIIRDMGEIDASESDPRNPAVASPERNA